MQLTQSPVSPALGGLYRVNTQKQLNTLKFFSGNLTSCVVDKFFFNLDPTLSYYLADYHHSV